MKIKILIKSMVGLFGRDESKDFEEFNLKIGDKIDVKPFVGNAYWYQPIQQGKVLFIYKHNVEVVNQPRVKE